MMRHPLSWLALAYLAACVLLGGSAQGVTFNFLLQLSGAAVLALAIALPRSDPQPMPRAPVMLAAAMVAWLLFQLVPLPASLWTQIPGRDFVVAGFDLLDMAVPAMPLSLDPNASIAAMLCLVPPAAMFVLVRRSSDAGRGVAVAALLFLALASIGLGILQVGGGEGYYLYPFVSRGAATGFFANANHFGALLMVALPFLAEFSRWWIARSTRNADRWIAIAGSVGVALVLGIGIVLNGSLAVLLLGVPVAICSLLIIVPRQQLLKRRVTAVVFAVAVAGSVVALIIASGFDLGGDTSLQDRLTIWSRTIEAIFAHGLTGTGMGTFPAIYAMHENPAEVGRFVVNHAHNDYLEWALELGVPGTLLILFLLGWWASRAVAVWSVRTPLRYARAASIASAALLAHSLVDFPLRTAAIAAIFGLCAALLSLPAPKHTSPSSLGREPRHVRIEELH